MVTGSCKWIQIKKKEEGMATYCSEPKSSDKNSLEICLTEACAADRNAVNIQ